MIKTVLAFAAVWAVYTGIGLVLSHMAMDGLVNPIVTALR